jgi:octaprenyl-diphosphate synthase
VASLFLREWLASDAGVLEVVTAEMEQVDRLVVERLQSEVALIDQIGRYIVSAGGKRVRPVVLLMTAHACGGEGPKARLLAAVVEFIHTATLLHDDVVDESQLRRGRETANALFGNSAAVLVGDFLYSRSFQMMVEAGDIRVLDVLAEATNVIARGEVMQLMNMHDAELGVDAYLDVVRFKTAKLFEASARLGAVLAKSDAATEQACAAYGRSLGTAFQLVDDLLDYSSTSADLGKNIGDDLREGKPTLPLLFAMERANPAQRDLMRQAVRDGGADHLDDVIRIVRETGAIEATREAARREAQQAQAALELLPESRFRSALIHSVVRLTERSS